MRRRSARQRAARVVVSVILLTAGAGFVFEAIDGRWDQYRFRQRGRTVQAGSLKLNLDCSGSGKRTVILDSGLASLQRAGCWYSGRWLHLREFVRGIGPVTAGASLARNPEPAYRSQKN